MIVRPLPVLAIIQTFLIFILGSVFSFNFFEQKKSTEALASFSLQFPGKPNPQILRSSAYAVSYTKPYPVDTFGPIEFHDPRLLLVIFGAEADQSAQGVTIIDQNLLPEEGSGIAIISLKKPDGAMLDSGEKYICDLGLDTICQVAVDKGYFQHILQLTGPRFLTSGGVLSLSFREGKVLGEIKNGTTKEGVSISGTFAIPIAYQDLKGDSWREEELLQAKSELSRAEAQAMREARKRDEQRISDLHTFEYALSLYFSDRGVYPLAELQQPIKKFDLEKHVLYQAFTRDTKYGLPKENFPTDPKGEPFFYLYGTVENGRGYFLSAALEGVKDPAKNGLCNLKISTTKCIYSASTIGGFYDDSGRDSGGHGTH